MEEKINFTNWIKTVVQEEMDRDNISETEVARRIGILQATLNAYTIGTRQAPISQGIIEAIINHFKDTHPEVYEVLGATSPANPKLYLLNLGFPPEFVDSLLAARREISKELSKKGIEKDSPEAREITYSVLAKHGLHPTDNE